jgi:RNA polymerase sigma factor (TIGR02999 family)
MNQEGTYLSNASGHKITNLLIAWRNGDETALDRLTPIVYDELRRIAKRYMANERRGHTLQPTALVNEAYVRLIGWKDAQWQNRAHFFAVAAQLMRRILVDFARSHLGEKRGGGTWKASFDEGLEISADRTSDLIAIDDALTALAVLNDRQSKVVELRFFGGLSLEETAEALQVSVGTVRRDWSLARAWMYNQLSSHRGHP